MSDTGAYLELAAVRKEFATHVAVEGFDLAVTRGEFVSFLGPSGCGKTTTLRMIAGFELPTSGTIRIDGRDISLVSPNARNVGMVFQSYALFPNMSAADNIAFGLKIRKRPKDAIRKRVDELLELIGMPGKGGKFPHELSGGMQQRVALARALAIEPQVLLLDEPLSALDAKIRLSLRQEIRSIQRKLGITTVYVTHDQEEALSLSDRIVVMSQGRIEQVGTPSEIYDHPATEFVARFVGQLNVLTCRVLDPSVGRLEVSGQELGLGQPLDGQTVGAQLSLAIRPEAIEMGPPGDANPRLVGLVRDIQFLGPVIRVRMGLDGEGSDLRFDTFNRPGTVPPQVGERITVSFPADSAIVLDASAALADPVEDEEIPVTSRWYRGNIHTHTTNSDGDSPPDVVVSWYRDAGYDFLVVTDHDVLTDPDGLRDAAGPMTLIRGEEISSGDVHVNGLGIRERIAATFAASVVETIQGNVDSVRAQGGVPSVNHPNFRWLVSPQDLAALRDVRLFEIHNAGPEVNNLGGRPGFPSIESTWDTLLSADHRMLGVAVDDAHHFQVWGRPYSNPGRAWMCVRTEDPTPAGLLTALDAGDCYASTGVSLGDVHTAGGELVIDIDQQWMNHYRTTFIGVDGRVLDIQEGLSTRYRLAEGDRYVRARVDDSDGLTAWIQPLFRD